MRGSVVAGVAILVLAAGAAHAQVSDVGSTFASGIEGAAQAFGQAAFAGPSLFITAKGRAALPAPIADAYSVLVQGRNVSAVQAARERDIKVAQILAAARRSGVAIELGGASISLEVDTEAQQAQNRDRAARIQARALAPGGMATPEPEAPPPKVFVAQTNLKFRAPATGGVAGFFDTIHAAGVDEISRGVGGMVNPFMPRGGEVFGFGSVETLDDSIWNAAGADALRKARAQAAALAAAGGRTLGPVKSIIVLSRGAEGEEATESLGVRFALDDPGR